MSHLSDLLDNKKMRPEPRFVIELKKSFALYSGVWFYKIPDTPKAKGLRFIPKKPFDIIMVYRGLPVAIEAKFHGKHTAWFTSAMRYNQVKALMDFEAAGGISLIMINVKFDKTNFAAILELDDLDRKSITVKKLSERAIYRGKIWTGQNNVTGWNVQGIFDV